MVSRDQLRRLLYEGRLRQTKSYSILYATSTCGSYYYSKGAHGPLRIRAPLNDTHNQNIHIFPMKQKMQNRLILILEYLIS